MRWVRSSHSLVCNSKIYSPPEQSASVAGELDIGALGLVEMGSPRVLDLV